MSLMENALLFLVPAFFCAFCRNTWQNNNNNANNSSICIKGGILYLFIHKRRTSFLFVVVVGLPAFKFLPKLGSKNQKKPTAKKKNTHTHTLKAKRSLCLLLLLVCAHRESHAPHPPKLCVCVCVCDPKKNNCQNLNAICSWRLLLFVVSSEHVCV